MTKRNRASACRGVSVAGMTRSGLCLALAMLSNVCGSTPPPERAPASPLAEPPAVIVDAKDRNTTELGLGAYAKTLCSALFVSHRDRKLSDELARALAVESMGLPETDAEKSAVTVNDAEKTVRISSGPFTRTAQHFGGQGCILHASPEQKLHFAPVPVKTTLPDAMSQPWPMGDAVSNAPPPSGVDMARVQKALDLAFAPKALTTAFLVVYKGQIIGERYAPGITKDTQLENWSMGKSLTATLLGLLVQDGLIKVDDPAPVPEWQQPGDPRTAIRVSDLLRMSSGLRCTREDAVGYTDHFYFYTGGIDSFRYAVSRPLEFPPNTVGRYRNCDPLAVGYIVKQLVSARGEEYLTYPQRALFDQIGIREQVLETDPYGNFLLTGHDYGTVRNWARIGMLYLNDGVWNEKRLLPSEFVKFVGTLAPAWKEPTYGGLFWVNGNKGWSLPPETFLAAGNGGQNAFIVPSHNLVIVRMGDHPGARESRSAMRAAQLEIMAAIGSPMETTVDR